MSEKEMVNKNTEKGCTGKFNTGEYNSGKWNSGNWNTGYFNTGGANVGNKNVGTGNAGDWNTGDYNIGDWNTGNCNTGDYNTGNKNTGSFNTGNWNTGSKNIGDWNKSSFNAGCFNTIESKMMLFNKPSDWTYCDWWESYARKLLDQIPKDVAVWVWSKDMTDEEKEQHPTYKETNGYLEILDESKCAQLWWDNLEDYKKQIIKAIPNFDAEIFRQCTGIDVQGGMKEK